MADTLKKLKIIIAVLAVMLGLSLIALVCVFILGQMDNYKDSETVPDNYIIPSDSLMSTDFSGYFSGRTLARSVPAVNFAKIFIMSDRAKETVISVYKNHAEDGVAFNCPNMFPGDSETRSYLVEVSHKGTVTVRFKADIRSGYEKLAEVLMCKVILREENKTLYEGLMRDMPESIDKRISSTAGVTTELTYDITVWLDTSVGNEYMNKELVADFRWWGEESGGYTPVIPILPVVPDEPVIPDEPSIPDTPDLPELPDEPIVPDEPDDPVIPDEPVKPDDGELITPPGTHDVSYFIWILAAAALVLVIILLISKKRKSKEEREEEFDDR